MYKNEDDQPLARAHIRHHSEIPDSEDDASYSVDEDNRSLVRVPIRHRSKLTKPAKDEDGLPPTLRTPIRQRLRNSASRKRVASNPAPFPYSKRQRVDRSDYNDVGLNIYDADEDDASECDVLEDEDPADSEYLLQDEDPADSEYGAKTEHDDESDVALDIEHLDHDPLVEDIFKQLGDYEDSEYEDDTPVHEEEGNDVLGPDTFNLDNVSLDQLQGFADIETVDVSSEDG
ncbi:uncharacterized protein B0T15DRAFT_562678 [Chaetomium strumarium]|uniref:Uncharacterized protein n=1 Tax=Chaetomium strumarium TaxID=1170767 RepID=A0AAJ0LYT7_9PEZI|nr:hypothetical protein B0T15DRAFT_562678 [Chaetomium strumarium]